MKKILIITSVLVMMLSVFVSCDIITDTESTGALISNESTGNSTNTQPASPTESESKTTPTARTKTKKEYKAMLNKLYQIEKGWTLEQVRELMGKPDYEAGSGICSLVYYMNDKETAYAMGDFTVWSVIIENEETGERTEILN